jgi:hypothetical protein
MISALVLLVVTRGLARAAVQTGNLLQNPGAEAGPGGTDSSGMMPPPDWTVTGDFTVVQYGAAGGFPPAATSASMAAGANFFAGGNAAVSTATQTVDVSGYAGAIDAGTEAATLSGDLGGYGSQDDKLVVTAAYLGASGGTLGSLTIGPVTAADRQDETILLSRSTTGAVPADTRSIQVVMTATRYQGEYNDGYGDNISLSLGTAPVVPLPVIGKTANFAPVSGMVYVKLPVSHGVRAASGANAAAALPMGQGFVPLTEARQLPVGTVVDALAGTLRVVTATTAKTKHAPARTQSGDFARGLFRVLQSPRRGLKGRTTLTLLDSGLFPGAPSYSQCPSVRKTSDAVSVIAKRKPLRSKVLQTLRESEHGNFETRGRYSAATVRGTQFSVSDRCDGTLTVVTRGTVVVSDYRRHKTITLHAHQSYLAKAP